MNKSSASQQQAASQTPSHLNNQHYNSSLLSSTKSNDASSYTSSSNINNKSYSSNSPSLATTTNTVNTNSLLTTDNIMIVSNASHNSSINTNNNNNTSNNSSPLKQSFNRPLRSFIGSMSNGGGSVSVSGVNANVTDNKKIGHREVKDGVVHYKKVPTDELKKSIQFGIVHSISVSNKYQDRDLLMHDFQTVETIVFPK